MQLAYFDDSGEAGLQVLGCVVVPDSQWLRTLDAWTDYRRWLRANFGLRMSRGRGNRVPVEIHTTDLVTGAKEWRKLGLSREARVRALRAGLRLIGRNATVFGVAWDPGRKASASAPQLSRPAVACWVTAIERLSTYSSRSAKGDFVTVFADRGYEELFRKEFRRMRRFHRVGSLKGGTLAAAAPMMIDDPIIRDSRQSAFVQMADMVAYAALRELRPLPHASDLWRELGNGVLQDVNKYQTGSPRGIKLLPP